MVTSFFKKHYLSGCITMDLWNCFINIHLKICKFWHVGTTGILQSHPFARQWKSKSQLATTVEVLLGKEFPRWSATRRYKKIMPGKSLFLLYGVAPGCSSTSVQHGTKFVMEREGTRLEESSGLLQTTVNA
jgi:hypothetical protein